jgi:tRNA G26 N,N-dimethylase Trm1
MALQVPTKLAEAVNKLESDRLGSLLKIAEQANNLGVLQISSPDLESLLGFAREKTDQIVTELEEAGFLTREQERNSEGEWDMSVIKLKVQKL